MNAVDDDAFKKYVQKAIEEVKKAGHWDDSKIPQMMLNLKGEEVKPVCMAPEGFVWISEENCGGRSLGEELPVFPGAGVMVSEKLALVKVGQDWVKGRLVKVEDVPDYVESLRKRYEVPTPVLAELSKALGPETAALEVEGAEAGKSPDDARILAVDYDAQDERYKEWKVVCQECAEYPFKDWPLEGPVCTHHMLKQMQRAGGTPRSWLQTWARFKQIPENDRIMFEMRTLVEAVEYGGTYDQLNLASLASFECISRRIMAIVDAFGAGGAGNPDWGAAKIFTGYRGPEDIVMPQLKQWASKKGKEEAELHQARTKMRELRRGVVTEEAAAAVAGGALPSAAAARRPGKKGVRQEGRLSRRSQQRFCRKARMQDDIRETVKALNWMNGFSPSLEFGGQPDDMQTQVLGRAVHLTKLAWGPGTLPTVPPEEAALRELLKGRSEYEDSSLPVTLARFEIERISLPETLEGVPDVAALLPAEARQYLESPELMVRDEARAGLFFVHKSDKKKIRLIVDARPDLKLMRSTFVNAAFTLGWQTSRLERSRFRKAASTTAREHALTSAGFVKDSLTEQWRRQEVSDEDDLKVTKKKDALPRHRATLERTSQRQDLETPKGRYPSNFSLMDVDIWTNPRARHSKRPRSPSGSSTSATSQIGDRGAALKKRAKRQTKQLVDGAMERTDLTLLEKKAIGDKSHKVYQLELEEFLSFARPRELNVQDANVLDRLVVEYFNKIYLEGFQSYRADRLA
ncbi:unnamed protein product, partial [Effrenium voratum]